MNKEKYLAVAIQEAKKSVGFVSPNPLVGAVIVKNGKIIGIGRHEKFGKSHAEINAFRNATENVEGAELYINLEPCVHWGNTPPCVDAIIEKKISKVVIGTLDPNPLVKGKGVQKLKEAGVEVVTGVLEKECRELNKFFFKYIKDKIPYITLKAAITLDGKIADAKRKSKWITSLKSREFVHQLRASHDAVLIGFKTVKKDNPALTVRLAKGRNPIKIIVDSKLRLNHNFALFENSPDAKIIILTLKSSKQKKKKINLLTRAGADFIFLKSDKTCGIDLKSGFKELGKRGILSVLVEGGSKIFSYFINKDLFDELNLFIAPKIIGQGLSFSQNVKNRFLKNAIKLNLAKIEKSGDDVLLTLNKSN